MKIKLQLLFLFVSIITYGQKTLKDFSGSLLFKETSYFERLSRECTDTTINYFSFDISKKNNSSEIEITNHYYLKNDFQEYKFMKFNFIKQHDSLLINYYNPIERKEVLKYIYPLNKCDTIEACGYRISYDSISTTKGEVDLCNNDPTFENTYLKDTIIKLKDYLFDCYVIEQNYNYFRNQTRIRKRIFIDKIALIPVYETEHSFAKRKTRGIPTNKWVLTKQMKLITID